MMVASSLVFFLTLIPTLVSSLILQAPLNPISGQSTLFTWKTEVGDPQLVKIALANPGLYGSTGRFVLGDNVLLSAGSKFLTLLSSQVPARNDYTVLALDKDTGATIARSDTFTVFTQKNNGLNLPVKFRIAIGVAVGLLILIVIIGGLWQRRRRQQAAANSMQQLPPPVTAQQPSYYASQPNPPYAGGGYGYNPDGGAQGYGQQPYGASAPQYPAQPYYGNSYGKQ